MLLPINFFALIHSLRSRKILLQQWFELCELWCIAFIQCAICSAFHLLNPGLVSISCFLKHELSFGVQTRQPLDRCTVGLNSDHLSPCPTPW